MKTATASTGSSRSCVTLQRREDGKTERGHPHCAVCAAANTRSRIPTRPACRNPDPPRARRDPAIPTRSAASSMLPSSPRFRQPLAFYRRELAARNWTGGDQRCGRYRGQRLAEFYLRRADRLAETQPKIRFHDRRSRDAIERYRPGRARQGQGGADDKFFSDAAAATKEIIAADEARRVAQAANLSDAPLRALADSSKPRAAAGERRKCEIRRRRRQARIRSCVEREGDRRVLSRLARRRRAGRSGLGASTNPTWS